MRMKPSSTLMINSFLGTSSKFLSSKMITTSNGVQTISIARAAKQIFGGTVKMASHFLDRFSFAAASLATGRSQWLILQPYLFHRTTQTFLKSVKKLHITTTVF